MEHYTIKHWHQVISSEKILPMNENQTMSTKGYLLCSSISILCVYISSGMNTLNGFWVQFFLHFYDFSKIQIEVVWSFFEKSLKMAKISSSINPFLKFGLISKTGSSTILFHIGLRIKTIH